MVPEDPLDLFKAWFDEARRVVTDDPTAMVLATADETGRPSSRFVLLKAFDKRGFVFYTNLESRKARELAVRPEAALCIYWAPLGRQVRIEGRAEPVSDAEADQYFASRPREYQIAAWASRQSAVLASRAELDERVKELERQFDGRPVPRPPFWSGFRLVADRIEFWIHRPNRLHERILYERSENGWRRSLLFP